MYRIEPYQASYLSSLTQLLDSSFSIQNSTKEALIRWKFFDEYHAHQTISYLALDATGEVASQYTNFPISLLWGSRSLRGMICADMATHADHRGKGLISQLSKRVYADVVAQGFELSIGFSTDAGVQVDKNSKRYGYRIVAPFQRFVKVITHHQHTRYRLQAVDAVDLDYSPPCADFLSIHKTGRYLDWRYLRKPNHDYLLYQLLDRDVALGYVVLRESGQRCYVLDIITDWHDPQHIAAILTAIHNTILERGHRLAIYYVVPNVFWRRVLRGMLPLPLRWSTNHHYLTVKPHIENLQHNVLLTDPNHWLLMAGDIL